MNVIEVEGIQKSYRKLKAVEDISFQVKEGEIFGIIGPNGAGKTTIIECLIGLRKADKGKIKILGYDPQLSDISFKQKIGVQLQEAMLPPNIKVGEVIDLFASLYHVSVRVDEILDKFEFLDKKNAFFSKLSGGQKQRLFIILATLHKPVILFFDELTTGLDPYSRKAMWKLMRDIREQGRTIIIATHLMEEAEQLCDRVAIINKGRLVVLDSPKNLIKQIQTDSMSMIQFVTENGYNLDTIKQLTCVNKYENTDSNTVIIYGKGETFFEEVMNHLIMRGIKFRELQFKKPSLEDVFFVFTKNDCADKAQKDLL